MAEFLTPYFWNLPQSLSPLPSYTLTDVVSMETGSSSLGDYYQKLENAVLYWHKTTGHIYDPERERERERQRERDRERETEKETEREREMRDKG